MSVRYYSWGGLLVLAALLFEQPVEADFRAAESGGSTNRLWVAPRREARKPNPIPADNDSVKKGKELYNVNCFPCHGPAGKGDGPSAPTLERNGARIRPGNLADPKLWQETDGELFWKISEGNSPMPSWGQTLNEEQRWLIIDYVRTLAPRSQPNSNTNHSSGSSG